MLNYKCVNIIVFIFVIHNTETAKILGIYHVPNKSHYTIGSRILYDLAAKGHQVTIASPYSIHNQNENFTEIYIDGVIDIANARRNTWSSFYDSSIISFLGKYRRFSFDLANTTLNSKGIQKLLKSGKKFDVVIFDLFQNQAFFGFGQHFNASTVVLSTEMSMFVNPLVGNIAPFAFVPNMFTAYSDHMNFVERLYNSVICLFISVYENLIIIPAQQTLYETHFQSKSTFKEAMKNASLFLINSHVLLESPRPYLPNMISVAGLHIKNQKLPEDLQEYLDNATEGVILFSLGSVLHSNNLPYHKVIEILNILGRLPQKILWKFEHENAILLPRNVKIQNWFPQNDILAHPNVKLFITHGGLLSCIESVYHGVPILGVPFSGDQFGNIRRLINSGYGKQLLFQDLTKITFLNTIEDILNNKSYFDSIKRDSKIFRDQSINPLDRAIFWIEHIIRHNGGRYLKSSSIDLPLVQYLLLDIIAIFLIIITCLIFVFLILLKICKAKSSKLKIN